MTQNATLNHSHRALEARLLETFNALWDDFVDPRDAYADPDGGWWLPVGSLAGGARREGDAPFTEHTLRELRQQCRRLAATNEFAINGHENRISYIVGAGHSYRASVCKGMDAPADVPMRVQKLLDEFQEENRWQLRQQEIVRRIDRDGEVFLRFFVDHEAMTRVRFVEPDQVVTPTAWPPTPRRASVFSAMPTMWKTCLAITSTANLSMPMRSSIGARTWIST